jgi:B9 domain-containing protein 2
VPASPGVHEVEIVTWRPVGSLSEEAATFFLGGTPQLRNDDVVVSEGDRFRLRTVTMGTVHAELTIMTKDFSQTGVKLGEQDS